MNPIEESPVVVTTEFDTAQADANPRPVSFWDGSGEITIMPAKYIDLDRKNSRGVGYVLHFILFGVILEDRRIHALPEKTWVRIEHFDSGEEPKRTTVRAL